jgi:hypothetical protein
MTSPDAPRPAIGDQYWFEFSRTLVDGAVSRRETAADALQKLVVWLWGIYTAAVSVGFALSGKQLDLGTTVFLALPSALLILVYWGTVWVQMPRLVAFDPRSPTEIEQAHAAIIRSKDRRLTFTLLLSVITAGLVSLGLVVAAAGRPSTFVPPVFTPVLVRDQDSTRVAVTALVGQATRADLRVTATGAGTARGTTLAVLVPGAGGLIQSNVTLAAPADSALVELEWQVPDGVRIRVSKVVARRP